MSRIVLEIKNGSHPLTGRLLAGEQAPAPFTGYLELIEVIEAVRHATTSEATRRARPGRRNLRVEP